MLDADWVSQDISRRFLATESESGSEIFLLHLIFKKIEVKSTKTYIFNNFLQSIDNKPDVLDNSEKA